MKADKKPFQIFKWLKMIIRKEIRTKNVRNIHIDYYIMNVSVWKLKIQKGNNETHWNIHVLSHWEFHNIKKNILRGNLLHALFPRLYFPFKILTRYNQIFKNQKLADWNFIGKKISSRTYKSFPNFSKVKKMKISFYAHSNRSFLSQSIAQSANRGFSNGNREVRYGPTQQNKRRETHMMWR